MKKIRNILFLLFFIFLVQANPLEAKEDATAYLFYGEGCPHCRDLEEYLVILKTRDKNLNVIKFETWSNSDNLKLSKKVKEEVGENREGVPFLIIGENSLVGFANDQSHRDIIANMIESTKVESHKDVVDEVIKKRAEDIKEGDISKETKTISYLPTKSTFLFLIVAAMVFLGFVMNNASQKK